MFKLLKSKLKSWLGKSQEKEIEIKKDKKKKSPKKEKKSKKNSIKKKKIKSDSKKEITQETPQKEEITQEISKEELEEPIKEEKIERKSFFSNILSKFTTSKIEKQQVEQIFEELEIILLEHNVALEVVDKIKENLINSLVGQESKNHQGTFIILFFGINGTGKTTSIAKLANLLKKNNISVALAAADTFRAAAIEQLEIHANKLKVPIIKGEYNTDPTSIAFDAKVYAEKHKIKCLLIDTAGRMYTKENLIKQMEKLIRVIKPNKKIFVGESTTGNDMLEQIKTFDQALDIDGIILSKADIDEKGGTALSVSYITKKPIYFLGTGQTYDDLKEFKKQDILESLGLN